jgi:two-component SAPR family response regulator
MRDQERRMEAMHYLKMHRRDLRHLKIAVTGVFFHLVREKKKKTNLIIYNSHNQFNTNLCNTILFQLDS